MDIEKRIGPLHDPVTWYKIPRTGEHASCPVGLPKQRQVKVDWYELLCFLLVSVVNFSFLDAFSCFYLVVYNSC